MALGTLVRSACTGVGGSPTRQDTPTALELINAHLTFSEPSSFPLTYRGILVNLFFLLLPSRRQMLDQGDGRLNTHSSCLDRCHRARGGCRHGGFWWRANMAAASLGVAVSHAAIRSSWAVPPGQRQSDNKRVDRGSEQNSSNGPSAQKHFIYQ
jgi:hypothetical protein